MKRAQIEIIGLVFIVLILSIALLIYVSSTTSRELTDTGDQLYKSFSSNELATGFIQTLLQTHSSTCQATVEEMVIDCGRTRSSLRCGFSRTSCDVAEQLISSLVDDTLDVWGMPFHFTILYRPGHNITFNSFDCAPDVVGTSAPGVFLLPYFPDSGVARITMGFCS